MISGYNSVWNVVVRFIFLYSQGYDARVNPGVLNEFGTSAFRVGHTMVPDDLLLLDHHYLPVTSVPIVNTFHNSSMMFLVRPGWVHGNVCFFPNI